MQFAGWWPLLKLQPVVNLQRKRELGEKAVLGGPQMMEECSATFGKLAQLLPCYGWIRSAHGEGEDTEATRLLGPPTQALAECLIPPCPPGLYSGMSMSHDRHSMDGDASWGLPAASPSLQTAAASAVSTQDRSAPGDSRDNRVCPQ